MIFLRGFHHVCLLSHDVLSISPAHSEARTHRTTRHTDSDGGSGTKTTVCDRDSDVLSLPFNPPVLPVTPPCPQVQTSRCVCSSDYLPAAGNCPDVLWEKQPVEATQTRPEEDPEGREREAACLLVVPLSFRAKCL